MILNYTNLKSAHSKKEVPKVILSALCECFYFMLTTWLVIEEIAVLTYPIKVCRWTKSLKAISYFWFFTVIKLRTLINKPKLNVITIGDIVIVDDVIIYNEIVA